MLSKIKSVIWCNSFLRRFISSLLIVLVTITAIICGPKAFYCFLSVISFFMFLEVLRVASVDYPLHKAIILGLIQLLLFFFRNTCFIAYVISIYTVVILAFALFSKFRKFKKNVCYFWITYQQAAIFAFALPLKHWNLMFGVFAIIWLTDTVAFLSGSLIGGPKLAPKVSPGKTWSGFICSILFLPLFFCIWKILFNNSGFISKYNFGNFILFETEIIFISLFATLGDLVESAIKRFFKVKDMGNSLPGHGGFCDRFDSLLGVGILFLLQYILSRLFCPWFNLIHLV